MSVISVTDYRPAPRFDDQPWISARLDGSDSPTGEWEVIETFSFEPDEDPAEPATRSFTTEQGDPRFTWLRLVWIDDDGNQDATDPVPAIPSTAVFANVHDVEIRLGRDLNERESEQAEMCLALATVNMLNAVDKDVLWNVPVEIKPTLSMLCVEIAIRGMTNPQALASQSESLGQHSVTQQYSRDIPGSGLMLTSAEELMLRRVVYGTTSGSVRTRSLANDVSDSLYLDDKIIYNGTSSEYK